MEREIGSVYKEKNLQIETKPKKSEFYLQSLQKDKNSV